MKINGSIPQENKGKLLGFDFIYRDFPETGMEEDFIEVRREIKKYITEVDANPISKGLEVSATFRGGTTYQTFLCFR